MGNPLFSFIIPHKNCPELLKRCVDSIPKRDDVQIIIVDDNSDNDKKPSIDQANVEVILLGDVESNGAGHARNVGIQYAKGDWLLFADADDYYNKDCLLTLEKYHLEDLDVVYFNSIYVDGITGEKLPDLPFQSDINNYDDSKECLDLIKFHHNVPWDKMVRNRFLKEHNISFEESINGNDIYFSMKVGYYAKKIVIQKARLYFYLRNTGSLVNRTHSVKTAWCKVRHRMELNCFYDFINHSEWKLSEILLFFQFLRKLGLPFAVYYIRNIIPLYKRKNSLVNFIKYGN